MDIRYRAVAGRADGRAVGQRQHQGRADGGVVDALGGTEGRENIWNSDRRFGDVLWNNIDQNRAILNYDAEKHPVARFGGQALGARLAGIRNPSCGN